MKFSDICTALPVLEMLDTKFDSLSWIVHSDRVEGTGIINKDNAIQIKLTVKPVTYADVEGVNVTFAVYDGTKYTEVFQNNDARNSAQIIGAVTNALKDKLDEFEWDFITLIAKDNVSSRSRLYTHIADRISKERGLGFIDFNTRNAHVTLLTSLTADQTRKLVDSITNT